MQQLECVLWLTAVAEREFVFVCVFGSNDQVDERVSEIILRGGHRATLYMGPQTQSTCDHHDHYHHHCCDQHWLELLKIATRTSYCAVALHQNSLSELLTTTTAVALTDKLFLMRYL